MSVVGFHHAGLHIADLERSLAFYRDLLGLEVVWRRVNREDYVRRTVGYPTAELHMALLRTPAGDYGIELIDYRGVERAPVDTHPPNPGTAHVCLLVQNLRELYLRLTDAGVESVSDPTAVTAGPNAGRLVVYLIDPDGFRVELLSIAQEAEE